VDEEADEEAKEKRSNMAVLFQFSVGTYDPLMSLLFPLIVDAKRRGIALAHASCDCGQKPVMCALPRVIGGIRIGIG
jgi:hypothetical protein